MEEIDKCKNERKNIHIIIFGISWNPRLPQQGCMSNSSVPIQKAQNNNIVHPACSDKQKIEWCEVNGL